MHRRTIISVFVFLCIACLVALGCGDTSSSTTVNNSGTTGSSNSTAAGGEKSAGNTATPPPLPGDAPQSQGQKQDTAAVQQASDTLGDSLQGVKLTYSVVVHGEDANFSFPTTLSVDYPKLAVETSTTTHGKKYAGLLIDDGTTATGCITSPRTVCAPLGASMGDQGSHYVPNEAVEILTMVNKLAAGEIAGLQGTGTKTIAGRQAVCGTFNYKDGDINFTWGVCLDTKTGAPLAGSVYVATGESIVAVAKSFGTSSPSDFVPPKNTAESINEVEDIVNDNTGNAQTGAADAANAAGGIADRAQGVLNR